MEIIKYLGLTLLLIGCVKEPSEPIQIHLQSSNGYLDKRSDGLRTIVETRDSVKYTYEFEAADFNTTVSKSKDSNDKATVDNFPVTASEERTYTIGTKKFVIQRYDVGPLISHEGVSYYFIDEYGIIASKSEVWTRTATYKTRDESVLQLLKELAMDTSGFYGVRPPPKQR